MQERLSIIIPTYNRAPILARCLEALVAQTLPKNQFEVVVCDDGSTDDTQAVLASFADRLSLQCLRQENKGPATARNRAIAVAKAPYLMIINDDSILAPPALAQHVAANAHNIITLGCFRTPSEYKKDFFTAMVDSMGWIFPFVGMKKPDMKNFDLFLTANLSLPAEAFKKVGGFDETFPSPAGEDIEMGYRLSKAGYVIMYDPTIECFHDNIYTPKGFVRLRYMRGVEDMRFLNKYPELIGHYQEMCAAMSRRWYARLKENPKVLADEVQKYGQLLEDTVNEYNATDESLLATRFRLIEKAYRLLDHVGFISYVEGISDSAYFDKIIGSRAIPFSTAPEAKDAQALLDALAIAA